MFITTKNTNRGNRWLCHAVAAVLLITSVFMLPLAAKTAGDTYAMSVSGTGSSPMITAPNPATIPVDPNNNGNLTDEQIFSGVRVSDAEDTNSAWKDWDDSPMYVTFSAVGGNQIPADEAGVYQVTYTVRDSNDNEAAVTVAVVLDDGGFPIDSMYVLQARSFIINSSAVEVYRVDEQILEKSGAQAWNTKGEPVAAIVNDTGAYSAQKGDYFPVVGVYGYPDLEKRIQVKVVDDSFTTSTNGDRYSIQANPFRINLASAGALAVKTGDAYSGEFIARSAATSYLRTGTELLADGTVELVDVVSRANASKNFTSAEFAEGDVYLATFRIAEEPNTQTTVEVIVSNGNPPVLTVPQVKVVLSGEVFGEAQYMEGVSAVDVEDGAVNDITHDSPVDTSTVGEYMVTYTARDRDNNVTTKAGMVLIGYEPAPGSYGIIANDFTKRVGQVSGTEAEAISDANAWAVDLRDRISDGTSMIPNPNFGEQVDVIVLDDGGYYGRNRGTFAITFAVKDDPTVRMIAIATVSAGNPPVLNVPAYKIIQRGDPFPEGSRNDTTPSYMQGVYAVDVEDGTDRLTVNHNFPVPPGVEGIYSVTYNVTDSDRNYSERTGMVLVGDWIVKDGYGILAYDFSRTLSQVTGTNSEMISSARARAIDLRQTLPGGSSNPNFGSAVSVVVADSGGYQAQKVGAFSITFAVQDMPSTTCTITATVGAGNPPTLSVPAYKQATYGSVFGEAQYREGVYAIDDEDDVITDKVIYDTPVNTNAEGVYKVTYSVTDSDGNTVEKSGIVLVGQWIPPQGYAITAHDFSKNLGQVTGTNEEIIHSAGARAIDLRQTLPGGSPNPNYGGPAPVVVADSGGYQTKRAGTFNITFAVQSDPATTFTITATVDAGNPPTLSVPAAKQAPYGSVFGEAQYREGVSAIDDEDGVITSKVVYNTPVNTNAAGAYMVTYSVTDSDGNTVENSGMVLVGSDDTPITPPDAPSVDPGSPSNPVNPNNPGNEPTDEPTTEPADEDTLDLSTLPAYAFAIADKTWTGGQIKSNLKITVSYKVNGASVTKTLKAGADYTITKYGTNKNIGNATVTIEGKAGSDYTGSKNLSFRIVPTKPTDLKLKAGVKSIKVEFKKVNAKQDINTYKIEYRVKGAKRWTSATATVKSGNAGKKQTAVVTLKKLKQKKTYEVRVYAYKGAYKSPPTSVKSAKSK